MKLLALLGPRREVATKYMVVASDVVIVALKNRLPQNIVSALTKVVSMPLQPVRINISNALIPDK